MTDVSPAVEKKAHGYLTSGAVKMIEHTSTSAIIQVSGSSKTPYVVRFSQGVWMCDCPGGKHGKECAHRYAGKLISPLRTEVGPLSGSSPQAAQNTDPGTAQEIADLLGASSIEDPAPSAEEAGDLLGLFGKKPVAIPDETHDMISFLDELS